ncbi:hypothetical protein TIFTF001_036292 [Ficus carica]|uniref:Uncharacterized protein n=1 Tax=Ficus carica TaxID=3494 RepID=A0AA88E337_FICCA|nr:hypothetical protein TIFTF001_036292 [Ficus carica]
MLRSIREALEKMSTPYEEDQGGSRRRVLIIHEKDGTHIADGLVQIVDDLDRCRTFPWGRPSSILMHPSPNSKVCNGPEGCHRTSAEDVLQRAGDTKNIRSILIPTSREQETVYIRSFVPDDDESDAIIDQWTIILENELSSVFWENVWYADLEGRQNFLRLHGSTKEVQREDPTEEENIWHENV